MSNSVFQSVILQLKDIPDRVFGVIDTDGCVVSCTDVALLGERWNDAALKLGLEMTLEHLKRQGAEVSPASQEALAWFDQ